MRNLTQLQHQLSNIYSESSCHLINICTVCITTVWARMLLLFLDWRGSLGFWSQGVESYYLAEQKLKSREQSNLPLLLFPSIPSFIRPHHLSIPLSTHQHKRLPSDTPLRSSFSELSSKNTRHTHINTDWWLWGRAPMFSIQGWETGQMA